ncbi:MAG: sensor histidine kinase [Thiohalocapsa sp.]
MAFTISARTILELGKELISSDDVAIYELIKNAVDAGSPTIRLETQVILPISSYKRALAQLKHGASTRTVFQEISNAVPHDAPTQARADFLDALKQAKNDQHRFQAKLTKLYRTQNWIRVADDGHGMSFDDLEKVFLRIGTRSRRAKNSRGATYLGDKGVGRLSAMRLGNQLRVETTMRDESRWHELDIDWTLFSHEDDKDLDAIPIGPEEGSEKDDDDVQGTTILISRLNGEWDRARFDEMISGRIARLVDPFTPGRANKLLQVRFNGNRVLVPSIPQSLLKSAHATLRAQFYFDRNDEPVLDGLIDYTLRQAKRPVLQRGAELCAITQTVRKRRGKQGHAARTVLPLDPETLKDLGSFTCEVYWFNRRVVEAISGLTENQLATRAQIAHWAGGPMLYRRAFRILPYGDPDDDWLDLDVAAFGKGGFKLNRRQVIGKVTVHSSHSTLQEQTNREGLVQSGAFSALKSILLWLLHVELRGLVNEADKNNLLTKREAENDALTFRQTRQAVQESLEALRACVADDHSWELDRLEREVMTLAGECAALVSRLDEAVDEAREEREKFVHLAGIGLMTEFIFHELDRAVTHTLKLLADARRSASASVLSALEEQLKTLQKRVSAFDDLSGAKRQRKTTVDVAEVASTVLEAHADEFRRHGIQHTLTLEGRGLTVKAVRGMLIQILENLLANSIYWLKQQIGYKVRFQPKLIVVIDARRKLLMLEDNAGGVAPERAEVIFQPFVSSKPPEQGRGLGLYISRQLAEYHGWVLEMDGTKGLYRPGRLNRFTLSMGEK